MSEIDGEKLSRAAMMSNQAQMLIMLSWIAHALGCPDDVTDRCREQAEKTIEWSEMLQRDDDDLAH